MGRKSYKIIFVFLILTGGICFGQKSPTKQELFEPFILLIIKPDSARITDSLWVWAQAIEKRHIDGYYNSIKQMKSLLQEDQKDKRLKNDIKAAKLREMDVLDFKYYHTVANATSFELQTLFNTNYWEENFMLRQTILDVSIIDRDDLFTYDFNKLGKYLDVDYIVTFEDIHDGRRNGVGTLTYTICLYWTKTNETILRKEVEGNAQVNDFKSYGDIFPLVSSPHGREIHCDNYLECMFKSAVRFSTEELFNAISKNQKK